MKERKEITTQIENENEIIIVWFVCLVCLFGLFGLFVSNTKQ